MPLSPTATRAVLAQLGLRPRRRLGQNFLVDGNIVRKSLSLAEVRPGDAVVEVGPGLGTLTEALLESGCLVWAVETDRGLHSHLAATLAARFPGRLRLLLGDAVEHPLAGWDGGAAPFKIVANLPYAIATPWLDAVLAGPLPGRMVLMLQREAALRYTAKPGTKAFGAISIFLQAAYGMEPGHAVAPSCFYPRPDVDSVLLNLIRRPSPIVFPAAIKACIRGCFQQRRKQIGALARDRLPGGATAWTEHLLRAGLSLETRPEAIPVAAWARLIRTAKLRLARPSPVRFRNCNQFIPMLRFVAALLIPLAALRGQSRADLPLQGHLDGDCYVSPSGAYKVPLPVLQELGGTISDTANVVTFQDTYSTHLSIACFPQDATQRWMLSTMSVKDYLKAFFEKYVLQDFAQNYKNAQVETNARYLPGVLDGAFIAYVLLPGGSMFTDRIAQVAPEGPAPVAKRGNMLFVKNGYIYIISTELAERVTEGSSYHKTAAEEDQILRLRLVNFAGKIQFLKAAADK